MDKFEKTFKQNVNGASIEFKKRMLFPYFKMLVASLISSKRNINNKLKNG